jgi:hypothetical protein
MSRAPLASSECPRGARAMHAKITLSDAGRQRRGVDSPLDELVATGSYR